jgi:mannose-6-phosphate isomerase-like protein (cupin superfamily)
MTVNALEAGEEAGYWHTHSQIEELYVFIGGQGQMGLDDDLVDVSAGSVVRVGQNVMRTWRAKPESTEQLQWLCIRAGGTELPDFPNDAKRDNDRPMPW